MITNAQMQTAKEIDLEKYKIEAKFIPILQATFSHMAKDAKMLYLATKHISTQSLANNYRPEFLTIIRQAQRETVAKFGFSIREDSQSKGYSFKTAKYKALIDYQIQSKDVDITLEPDSKEKINQEFALAASLYVANSTEEQVDYITNTNEKEISDAEKLAIILFFKSQSKVEHKLNIARNNLRQFDFDMIIGASESVSNAKREQLKEKIKELELQLDKINKGKDLFIGNNIEKKIIQDGSSRSELIASQNVGMAESWARNEEAQLIDNNIPEIKIKKKWEAILDKRTRATHIIADGQIVNVNEKFIVGGYEAKYPRDGNLPPKESANCRCIALHFFDDNSIT